MEPLSSYERWIELAERARGPRLRWPPGTRSLREPLLVVGSSRGPVSVHAVPGGATAFYFTEGARTHSLWNPAEAIARLLRTGDSTAITIRPQPDEGRWRWDLGAGELSLSDSARRLLRIASPENQFRSTVLLERLAPPDRLRLLESLDRVMAHGGALSVRLRLQTPRAGGAAVLLQGRTTANGGKLLSGTVRLAA